MGQRLLAQTKFPEDRRVWKEERGQVFLIQPQYKQSIDHHREGTWALSSPDTWRVPWSVLTILPRASCYICLYTKYMQYILVYTKVYDYIFGIFPLAFSRLIVGYLYERGDENKTCN